MKNKVLLLPAIFLILLVLGSCGEDEVDNTVYDEDPIRSEISNRTGDIVQGGTFRVNEGDFIYIYVDPVGVPDTSVVFDNLVVRFNNTNYPVPRVDPDSRGTQGPEWYYVWRRIEGGTTGEWIALRSVFAYNQFTWRLGDGNNETYFYSIFAYESDLTIWSGYNLTLNSTFELGIAFKAPGNGTVSIADFEVISHEPYTGDGVGGFENDPNGIVDVVIEPGPPVFIQ